MISLRNDAVLLTHRDINWYNKWYNLHRLIVRRVSVYLTNCKDMATISAFKLWQWALVSYLLNGSDENDCWDVLEIRAPNRLINIT